MSEYNSTLFQFKSEIDVLEQTRKVVLEENGNDFILKNDFCMVVVDRKKAVIKKFYTKEGNEICGSNGNGYYLINYTDSGHVGNSKQEMTLNNCIGTVIRQSDDICEVSVKENRLRKD